MTRFIAAVAMACALMALAIPAADARPQGTKRYLNVLSGPPGCVSLSPGREMCPEASARAGAARAGRAMNANGNEARRARSEGRSASTSRRCLTSDTRAILERAEAHFGVTFKLVSTCRPGALIAGTNHVSEHAHGRAVDLLVPRGISKQAVVKWLFANAPGVTMVYRAMPHVHFDTGRYHKLACGGCGRQRARHQRVVHVGGPEAATP